MVCEDSIFVVALLFSLMSLVFVNEIPAAATAASKKAPPSGMAIIVDSSMVFTIVAAPPRQTSCGRGVDVADGPDLGNKMRATAGLRPCVSARCLVLSQFEPCGAGSGTAKLAEFAIALLLFAVLKFCAALILSMWRDEIGKISPK